MCQNKVGGDERRSPGVTDNEAEGWEVVSFFMMLWCGCGEGGVPLVADILSKHMLSKCYRDGSSKHQGSRIFIRRPFFLSSAAVDSQTSAFPLLLHGN